MAFFLLKLNIDQLPEGKITRKVVMEASSLRLRVGEFPYQIAVRDGKQLFTYTRTSGDQDAHTYTCQNGQTTLTFIILND